MVHYFAHFYSVLVLKILLMLEVVDSFIFGVSGSVDGGVGVALMVTC
jgi:hypothetical protein